MSIDLKWLLPFVLPFAILAMVRGVAFFAGAVIDPHLYWGVSVIFGTFISVGALIHMSVEEIRWNVTIGKGEKK